MSFHLNNGVLTFRQASGGHGGGITGYVDRLATEADKLLHPGLWSGFLKSNPEVAPVVEVKEVAAEQEAHPEVVEEIKEEDPTQADAQASLKLEQE